MKFVIKDHLEMIPDILSVIDKMTKDEGNFYNNILYYNKISYFSFGYTIKPAYEKNLWLA